MAQIRPKILVRIGRQNQPLQIPIADLLGANVNTFLTSDTAASAATLTVKNVSGFAIDNLLLVGEAGNEGTEVVKSNHATAPLGSTITLISGTSTTSLAIATGTKTFTTQSGLTFAAGDRVRASSDASSANYMEGIVTSYSSTTLVVSVDTIGGSGTLTDWTIRQVTKYPHSSSTPIYVIPYDQIEISTASFPTDTKTVVATINVLVDSPVTFYTDSSIVTGVYFARFKTTIGGTFSPYSDAAPVAGYTILTARSIIDNALEEINREQSNLLSDEYAFKQINNCQMEVLREFKRWSFMESFGTNIGQTQTGQWRVALPDNIDNNVTNNSIYNFRLGTDTNMIWVDKAKWNQITAGVANTLLGADIIVGATTIQLDDSSNFDDGGTVYIGANTYEFTANDRDTGILTLGSASTTTNTEGEDVFFNASLGLPRYWTTFGGFIYHYPVTGENDNLRIYSLDYYKALTPIVTDTDEIVLPDPTVVQYYLQWKFLRRINNGGETEDSQAAFALYVTRRDRMKKKETIGRTYRLKPIYANWARDLSDFEDDDRRDRLGNFPNI